MGENTIVICLDEAHFKIDADRRRCWAKKGTTPIVYQNGSKKAINIGGGLTGNSKFHYQQMERQVKEEVLRFVKRLHRKYLKSGHKVLILLDKAPWHKNKLVIKYFELNNETIDYMFLPTGAPDLNPVEECWHQTRDKETANTSYDSEKQLGKSLKSYWNKQPFNLNLSNYLCP